MNAKIEKFYREFSQSTINNESLFDSFSRKFKNVMKIIAQNSNCELVAYRKGTFEVSGFLQRNDGQCIYFATFDSRAYKSLDDILFRKAAHIKDYRGESNHFSNLFDLADNIKKLN